MHDPIYQETEFGWTPTGAWLPTPKSQRVSEDRQRGTAARWYSAALPRKMYPRAAQLGEAKASRPRQLGEFECGLDDL